MRIANIFFTKNLIDFTSQFEVNRSIHPLVDDVVSVLEEVFVPGAVLEGELSEKVTGVLVGVDLLDLPLGIFEMALNKWFSM